MLKWAKDESIFPCKLQKINMKHHLMKCEIGKNKSARRKIGGNVFLDWAKLLATHRKAQTMK